jgi:hypothetical protein
VGVANNREIVRLVAEVLKLTMAIDADELKRAVQAAHECDGEMMTDPPERFEVSRQALRMFWHFRCNLEAVLITVEPEAAVPAAEEEQ